MAMAVPKKLAPRHMNARLLARGSGAQGARGCFFSKRAWRDAAIAARETLQVHVRDRLAGPHEHSWCRQPTRARAPDPGLGLLPNVKAWLESSGYYVRPAPS